MSEHDTPFGHTIEPAPEHMSGANVLSRFIDGLAFRYYWATEELREQDFLFRPSRDSMCVHEVMAHILDLAMMIRQAARNEDYRQTPSKGSPEEIRKQTLDTLHGLRDLLRQTRDETIAEHRVLKRDGKDWPIWHIMNGPLADALTHVGQIVSWRRINGNPMPKANVFLGRPPR